MDILTNGKKNNPLNCLKKMAAKADTLIIVSPFVTDDISMLIEATFYQQSDIIKK